ncbi:hypothetical protein SD427_08340 [Chryseobacterium sp. JJR-5R]|nr:hypothetical protein [Chryseobacterium sp. JJR-5R]WPO84331.1 hypothetical protein SD427_08340 [Chryseobacterium sp. JJR-5R]
MQCQEFIPADFNHFTAGRRTGIYTRRLPQDQEPDGSIFRISFLPSSL